MTNKIKEPICYFYIDILIHGQRDIEKIYKYFKSDDTLTSAGEQYVRFIERYGVLYG